MTLVPFSIGLDDTDSPDGMCTTFLGSLIFLELGKARPLVELTDLPHLVRLNPNVPHKTRGNGAVVVRGWVDSRLLSWLQSVVTGLFLKWSHVGPRSNPGLVVCVGDPPQRLLVFARRVLWDLLSLDDLKQFEAEPTLYLHSLGNGQGLVGALAAVGSTLTNQDHTFELLVYRPPPHLPDRSPNLTPVWAQEGQHPCTFGNVDAEAGTVKLFPQGGGDPVYCGIRGDSPDCVWRYWETIQPQPTPWFWMIYRTNQGTNAHINETPLTNLKQTMRSWQVVSVTATVAEPPNRNEGGHVCFSIKDGSIQLLCYAYEPTKAFRDVVMQLIPGDLVQVGGGLRPPAGDHPLALNIEELTVLNLAPKTTEQNPHCPRCGKRMESAGRGQPFRCRRCKLTKTKDQRVVVVEPRLVQLGVRYVPPVDARRHLTKPPEWHGRAKDRPTEDILESWVVRAVNQQPKELS